MSWLADTPERPAGAWLKLFHGFVLLAVLAAACWWLLAGSLLRWDSVWNYRGAFLAGWWATIAISALALVASLGLGVGAALMRRSRILPIRYLATGYVELIRGTPLLVQILFIYYVIAAKVEWHDRFAVGVLALSLFSGAYICEMVRAGIESVGKSQLESARAIGLTSFQTYRYVIFPQALRQILPPMAGQFASLIKDSSLLSVVGLSELTHAAIQINSATYSTLEVYFPLAVAYLLLTLPVSLLSRKLEAMVRYET